MTLGQWVDQRTKFARKLVAIDARTIQEKESGEYGTLKVKTDIVPAKVMWDFPVCLTRADTLPTLTNLIFIFTASSISLGFFLSLISVSGF